MKLQPRRTQTGNGKTGTFSPCNMGNGVYERSFMLEIAFDPAEWRRMMTPYGLGTMEAEEEYESDANARMRQTIIDKMRDDCARHIRNALLQREEG